MTNNLTSSDHTPGPWIVDNSDIGDKTLLAEIRTNKDANGYCCYIAHVYGISTPNRLKANACLIAAAPELLEACKAAFIQTTDHELSEILSDAIAKASL
jgi:hypothetical protein